MLRRIVLCSLPAFGPLFFGCSDEKEKHEAKPPTRLQIQLKDQGGAPLAGVPVQLYNTLEDWQNEQNPVQTTTSLANGTASFVYLTDAEYFVNAVSGSLSNWEGNVFLTGIQPGFDNSFPLTLRPYPSSMLSSAAGKNWHLVRYKENGVELIDDTTKTCIIDNIWTFYKGASQGDFRLNESAVKCDSLASQYQYRTWHFASQSILLKQGQTMESYELEHLSETTLRLNRTTNGITYSYTLQ